jgi:hypothetical protein
MESFDMKNKLYKLVIIISVFIMIIITMSFFVKADKDKISLTEEADYWIVKYPVTGGDAEYWINKVSKMAQDGLSIEFVALMM